jgi:hypothetical protein
MVRWVLISAFIEKQVFPVSFTTRDITDAAGKTTPFHISTDSRTRFQATVEASVDIYVVQFGPGAEDMRVLMGH